MSGKSHLPEVAIVGGGTLLGQEIKELLASRAVPVGEVRLLSAEEEEEAPGLHARLTDFGGEAVVETPLAAAEVEDAAIVFVCERAASGHPALEAAARIIDVTRGGGPADPAYLLAVSGINDHEVAAARKIASPHPVTVMIAHVLHALGPLGIRDAVATALLGASDAGRPGVDELLEQTRAALNFTGMPTAVFDRQLAFNLFPPFGPRRVEAAVVDEIRLLTHIEVAVSVVTVPIFYGAACTLRVAFEPDVTRAAVEAALAKHALLSLRLGDDTSPVGAVGDDAVLVGALEPDTSRAGAFWIWAVCDNARRGAALNAVELAERILGA